MMNKKKIIGLVLMLSVAISANVLYNKNVDKNNVSDAVSGSYSEENEIENIKDSLPDVNVEEEKSELKEAKFKFKVEEGALELEFGTPWKANATNDKFLAIEGRGFEGIEEGFGYVCLKENGSVKNLFIDDESLGMSPKYVEWLEDDSFLIYMVNSYGRVFSGGTLYIVNINDMIPKIVYEAKENEEISEATQINADIINMKILSHDNNNMVSVEKNIKFK